jgi:hypothetical protein
MQGKLSVFVATIVALFAAFGGFLGNIAPPEVPGVGMHAKFAVGLAYFAALIVLMLLRTLPIWGESSNLLRHLWFMVGAVSGLAFVILALNYDAQLETKTFDHKLQNDSATARYIIGDTYTASAAQYVQTNPVSGPEELLRAGKTDDPTLVWTKKSLIASEASLIRLYQTLVVLLCISLFTLLPLVKSDSVAVTPPDPTRSKPPGDVKL